jgi:hypothetical protein
MLWEVWGRVYVGARFLDLTASWRYDQLQASAALLQGKKRPILILWETGWASDPVWTTERTDNF